MPEPTLVRLSRVGHRYVQATGAFGLARRDIETLKDIDLEIAPGEFIAIVGPSGAGKSTLLRIMAGLMSPTEGEIRWGAPPRARPERLVQVLFQNAAASFDPRLTLRESLLEPLLAHRIDEPAALIRARLEEVGLDEDLLSRPPSQLSGGEAQRLALARALSLDPKLLLADEPTASLDTVSRAEVARLLRRLRDQRRLGLVLVTHDLPFALSLVDSVLVLSEGQIVERAQAMGFTAKARHAVSRSLLIAPAETSPQGRT